MGRRVSLRVLLVLVLVGAGVPVAGAGTVLAEGVDISGWVRQDFRLNLGVRGTDGGTTVEVWDPWVQLVISGDLSDDLGLYIRLVDSKPAFQPFAGNRPSRPFRLLERGYVTVRGLAPGFELTAGRQLIFWTLLQERVLDDLRVWGPGNGFSYFPAPVVMIDYASGPLGLSGYYTPEPEHVGERMEVLARESVGARATYSTGVAGLDALVGAQVVVDFRQDPDRPAGDPANQDAIGWGVQGQLGKGSFYVYGEYGQPDTDTGARFWVVGARFGVRNTPGRLFAWAERDIENDEMAFELSRPLTPYFQLIFGGDTRIPETGAPDDPARGDDEWALYLITRFGLSF